MTERLLRARMCEVGRRLWERGLVGGAEGNLSARLGRTHLLCTPSRVCKGHMNPDDLVLLDLDGAPAAGGEPSSEILMHLRCYSLRPDCQAVVHAHPPIATGFAVAGRSIAPDVMPEAGIVLGPVGDVPFAMTGTAEVPDAMEPLLPGHKTFLLSHHGAVALGRDVEDACERMETLERVCRVLLVAELLGGARPMPAEAWALLSATTGGRL